MKCVKCNKVASKDEEYKFTQRMQALHDKGIVVTMAFICEECQGRVKEIVKWQLTDTEGGIQ